MTARYKHYFCVSLCLTTFFFLHCHSDNPAQQQKPLNTTGHKQHRMAPPTPPIESASPKPSPHEHSSKPPIAEDGLATNAPFQLPRPWAGTGIISRTSHTPYRIGPHWGKHNQVEIITAQGTHYLRATARAKKISNINLLRSTAVNRARQLLQTTLQQHNLQLGEIVRTWKHPKRPIMIVQVQTPIPSRWANIAQSAASVKDSSL